MKTDEVLLQARAKVIWGEPSVSVRVFLILNGVSDQEADAKIKEFTAERSQEIRRIGIRKILIGAASTVGVSAYFYLIYIWPSIGFSRVPGVIAVAGFFYGLWQFFGGIIYLARPQAEGKSISEI